MGLSLFTDPEWESDDMIAHRVNGPGGVQEIRESFGLHAVTDASGLPGAMQGWIEGAVTPYEFFLEMRLAKLQQLALEAAKDA